MIKKILCIHRGEAYLPEIFAYKKYFNKFGIDFVDSVSDLNGDYNIANFDLLWFVMGHDFCSTNIPKVHDYASLSTGNFKFAKNRIKRYCNKKPALRLFLNEYVRNDFGFDDDVPYLLRDMGIADHFFCAKPTEKNYDFVYLGAVNNERNLPRLFNIFYHEISNKKLLVIGNVPTKILSQYNRVKNIYFTGGVDYQDIPQYASQAEYGINLIPDRYPFNIQTSTKLLEYCALGLKIVTTSYDWLNYFEKKYDGKFYKLDSNLNNFSTLLIDSFSYKTPLLEDMRWNNMLEKIKLMRSIENIL